MRVTAAPSVLPPNHVSPRCSVCGSRCPQARESHGGAAFGPAWLEGAHVSRSAGSSLREDVTARGASRVAHARSCLVVTAKMHLDDEETGLALLPHSKVQNRT